MLVHHSLPAFSYVLLRLPQASIFWSSFLALQFAIVILPFSTCSGAALHAWAIYKLPNSFLPCDGLASHPGGSINTPSRFMLQKPEISAGLMGLPRLVTETNSFHLRTFAPIATAHPYSARKFTCHVMHRAHAQSTKMNNDRGNGHCYSFAWI